MRVQNPPFFLLLMAALVLTACGGSSAGSGAGLDYGNYPVPDGPGDVPPGSPPDDGPGGPPPPDLVGGVLVTIETLGERWRWWVTNPDSAQALYEVWTGARSLGWFGGPLRDGQGAGNHNAPWSWHVDPQRNAVDVSGLLLPEMSRTPSQCESRLSYWLSIGAHFIPADGTIVELYDRRLVSEPPVPR